MKSSWMLPPCCCCYWIAALLAPSASSFLAPVAPTGLKRAVFAVSKNSNNNMDHLPSLNNEAVDALASPTIVSSRRDWMQKSMAAVAATSMALLGSTTTSALADDEAAPASTKILLLGGTGLVGSQIRNILKDQGISVVATSRNGRDDTVAFDFTTSDNVAQQVQALAKGCTAVISTVGVLGTSDDSVVNGANALAAAGAKAAGVSRFVYITVSPEVKDFAQNIDFLQSYLQGKTFARDAVIHYFGGGDDDSTKKALSFTLIEPTFIYGGDTFQVNPPRVTGLYGSLIEGALSSAPLRLAANLAPAGFFKVALEPPVSAEAVAKAAIAGALGKTTTSNGAYLDTYDKIQAAADLL